MSTIRGWWEEDPERSQRFYNQILVLDGEAPGSCETWISEEVLQQHLNSFTMWAIFPIQDLIGIDDKLMRKDPAEERINDPSNPDNLWQYRFHMNFEDLIREKEFNKRLRTMIQNAGRSNGF
jgi:4-alpha-glucanotransferase